MIDNGKIWQTWTWIVDFPTLSPICHPFGTSKPNLEVATYFQSELPARFAPNRTGREALRRHTRVRRVPPDTMFRQGWGLCRRRERLSSAAMWGMTRTGPVRECGVVLHHVLTCGVNSPASPAEGPNRLKNLMLPREVEVKGGSYHCEKSVSGYPCLTKGPLNV